MTPGPTQLIIVLVIVLLLFGAKKIPELAKGLGTGMREFRQGASGAIEDDTDSDSGESKVDKEASAKPAGTHEDVSSEDETSEASKTEQRS